MARGKATMNVPPAPTSQTSCQLQSGPIAAMTSRRSAGVLATTKCSAPAPKSQPSRTENTMSMKERRTNQSSTNGHLCFAVLVFVPCVAIPAVAIGRVAVIPVRAVKHLARNQGEIQKAEHEIHSGEPNERKENASGADDGA